MIKLVVNHKYSVDVANIVRLFYGKQEIEILEQEALGNNQSFFQGEDIVLKSILENSNGVVTAKVTICHKTEVHEKEISEVLSEEINKQSRTLTKITMYKLLSVLLDKTYPWGILTGIRPIKIVHDLMDKGKDRAQISLYMKEHYLTSQEKIDLSIDIAERERRFIYPADQRKASVYIGIPFCPTRCHYCSFTSNSIKSCGDLVEQYLQAMLYEMECTSEFMELQGIEIETIYVGGGTPTSITAKQLDRVLNKAQELFGRDCIEFTCEAGRPDTITTEKLQVMKKWGVTRISINPQTMNNDTLQRIGRNHTVEETIQSFDLAREYGFDNINMDMILGLPGEGMEHLDHTLKQIKALQPESLTIHTMAVKRASIMNENHDKVENHGDLTSAMMEKASAFAFRQGMKPYYLYRQKHMVENLENIGFAKPGFECIYNMQIIEEKQTNIAFGADSITKTVDISSGIIKRQGNIKDIRLYIANIQQQIDKKLQLLAELYKNLD